MQPGGVQPMPVTRRIPAHLRDKTGRVRLRALRRFGNRIAAFYRVPVYLCGSALLDFNAAPRDWDVRITLSDLEFRRRFGDAQAWEAEGRSGVYTQVRWGWSDRCVKDSKDGYNVTGLNVDCQIYPESHARHYRNRPRLRLDSMPVKRGSRR